ncbi:hypothetical protein TL16_g01952 [Triparma laevis f. inornata]|uniref:BLUF domain-containing protein n=1 Tax=Triparma laevis f. inornata TaxID=1714386 RepID=A0A9W7DTF6_9STRA|nr:hypothetical protein TL16_g01952 [Triparma laevis f. inornata]
MFIVCAVSQKIEGPVQAVVLLWNRIKTDPRIRQVVDCSYELGDQRTHHHELPWNITENISLDLVGRTILAGPPRKPNKMSDELWAFLTKILVRSEIRISVEEAVREPIFASYQFMTYDSVGKRLQETSSTAMSTWSASEKYLENTVSTVNTLARPPAYYTTRLRGQVRARLSKSIGARGTSVSRTLHMLRKRKTTTNGRRGE